MVEKNPVLDVLTYVLLFFGVALVCFPVLYCLCVASLPTEATMSPPIPFRAGLHLLENIRMAMAKKDLGVQMWNSLYIALAISLGKITVSFLSAYAVVYFRFRARMFFFWLIFLTLMLPVEVRILPTYEVTANLFSPLNSLARIFSWQLSWKLSLLDTYSGIIFPIVASATATFLFRQFFLTVPEELCEAAKIDGATPMQFLWKVLLPLSKTNIAALFVILFVTGWNQYLWPLLVTTDNRIRPALVGVQELIPRGEQVPLWNVAMAGTVLVMIPPVLVVLLMQRWFVKGLIEHEK